MVWGRSEQRDLPWRHTRDPWAVLVSELMLQQTQVVRVVPRWSAFLDRFGTPSHGAAAPLGDVLRAWHGLGYPRRAANLHAAATLMVAEHDGQVPEGLDALLRLPGIGPYTARAVLVFAFERREAVVDTNVGRLLARWGGAPLTPKQAQAAADRLVAVPAAAADPWAWNTALLDLAAATCTKRSPACAGCPMLAWCAWGSAGAVGPDPAVGSAAVSGRQAPYEGSDRQFRGRVLDALMTGPVAEADLVGAVGLADDPARFETLLAGLAADRLVARDAGRVSLPD